MAAFINTENTVKKIYNTVIDEVLTNIREAFLDEGYDEQLLQELKQMWETKLSQSRALMPSASSDDAATTTSAAAAAAAATSSSTEHHHSHHHHSSGSSGGGGMRLPITQAPTAKEIAHQALTRNLNNMPASVSSVSSSRSQTPSPGPSDVKPIIHMDAATRAAIQALPQQFHYAQQQQQQHHHHHHQQAQGGNQQQDKQKKMTTGAQLDGHRGGDGGGSSSEDEDDELGAVGSAHGDDEDDDEDDEKATGNDDPSEYEGKEDPDPLNSGDDLTEPGSPDSNSDLFDTDNVIVCQYDKITRIKNKWKFHLKDGIMNINGRDYLFSKANGDAEW